MYINMCPNCGCLVSEFGFPRLPLFGHSFHPERAAPNRYLENHQAFKNLEGIQLTPWIWFALLGCDMEIDPATQRKHTTYTSFKLALKSPTEPWFLGGVEGIRFFKVEPLILGYISAKTYVKHTNKQTNKYHTHRNTTQHIQKTTVLKRYIFMYIYI